MLFTTELTVAADIDNDNICSVKIKFGKFTLYNHHVQEQISLLNKE